MHNRILRILDQYPITVRNYFYVPLGGEFKCNGFSYNSMTVEKNSITF